MAIQLKNKLSKALTAVLAVTLYAVSMKVAGVLDLDWVLTLTPIILAVSYVVSVYIIVLLIMLGSSSRNWFKALPAKRSQSR